MQRIEVIEKVMGVLEEHCENPSVEIRKLGEALVAIADSIEGLKIGDARRVMKSVAILYDSSNT